MSSRTPQWGQVVCGPPGSGKSTYCEAMHHALNAAGRKTIVVNLDPANEDVRYPCAIDVRQLISADDAAAAYSLGPNGALMYCVEYLEANSDWLLRALSAHADSYVLLDCPGQAELYTHHASFFRIFQVLQARGFRVRPPTVI